MSLVTGFTDQRQKYGEQSRGQRMRGAVVSGEKLSKTHSSKYVFGLHYTLDMGRESDFVVSKSVAWRCCCGAEMEPDAAKCRRCGCTERPEFR